MIWFLPKTKSRDPQICRILRIIIVGVFLILGFYFLTTISTTRSLRVQLPTQLVIIPGHGIFKDNNWIVADWLKPLVPEIEDQIRYAVSHYGDNLDNMIMTSGGETNEEAGHISEAQGYMNYIYFLGLNPSNIQLEEFAKDSFENILFSICRFKQLTGTYPLKIVIVGFEFKRLRFETQHLTAIRFSQYEYIGIGGRGKAQVEMEKRGTVLQFQKDPYGCLPPLSTKRKERNPFHQINNYATSGECEEIKELFYACGKNIYKGSLPWDKSSSS